MELAKINSFKLLRDIRDIKTKDRVIKRDKEHLLAAIRFLSLLKDANHPSPPKQPHIIDLPDLFLKIGRQMVEHLRTKTVRLHNVGLVGKSTFILIKKQIYSLSGMKIMVDMQKRDVVRQMETRYFKDQEIVLKPRNGLFDLGDNKN